MCGPLDLELAEIAGGTRLRLRVKPGARRNAIVGSIRGALKIAVVAAPERGKANRAVLELLAAELGIPLSSLKLLSGETSHDKTVRIPLPPAEVASRLMR
jgi:uncharacterized protein